MPNTSATGGILRETNFQNRVELENLWHDYFVGITGLDTNLVRPAEQRNPPTTPGADTNWLAFKITNGNSNDYPDVMHSGAGDGEDIVIDHTPENIMVYVFGPLADDIANTIRRATHITQNRDMLRANGIGVQRVGSLIQVPTLQNVNWYRRVDLTIYTVREAIGKYAILNLSGAEGIINTDIKHGMEDPLHRLFKVEE